MSDSVRGLFRHFKSCHGLTERHARYSCYQGQCCRTFSSKYVFSRHLESCHISNQPRSSSNSSPSQTSRSMVDHREYESSEVRHPDQSVMPEVEPGESELNLSDLACKFICQAKSRLSTVENVNSMVNACTEIVDAVVGDLHRHVLSLRTSSTEEDWRKIDDKFAAFRDPFKELRTQHRQTVYISKLGAYVAPEDHIIGRSQHFVMDKKAKFAKPTVQDVTGQFISVKKSMHALNNHTSMMDFVACNPHVNVDKVSSFFDGMFWKDHPLRDQKVVLIRLYGDDFEPANALGSHKSIYKVGCIYWQFENLPVTMRSNTENIFLALCYHTQDIKTFGWAAVLAPLLQELLSVETDGVDLVVNGQMSNYKVVLSCITGDNLFLNGLFGFVESFTAGHPCRHCDIHRGKFGVTSVEELSSVRTVASYNHAVANVDVQQSGIKFACVFNELRYFHAVTNYVQDIMHDILEGVCSYDIVLICSKFVGDGLFSIDVLNSRLQCLNYGYHDQCNKPPVVSSFDNEMLSMDAAQIWCLARYLSVAVGQFIDMNNEVWQLFLQLRQIMDIIFAPIILSQEIKELRFLISEYLQLRSVLFPLQSIKNKHHHMIHYPRLIQQMGPMCHLWCMRFEQKHQRYKRLMHIGGNFINVPKTIAVRHQNDVASQLLLNCQSDEIETGKGEVVVLKQLTNGVAIDLALGGGCIYMEFFKCSSIKIFGTSYKSGCYLLSGFDEEAEIPQFAQLLDILVRDQKNVIFFCEQLNTVQFNNHFHAWHVQRTCPRQYLHLNPKTLSYFIPMTLQSVMLCDGPHAYDVDMLVLRHRM